MQNILIVINSYINLQIIQEAFEENIIDISLELLFNLYNSLLSSVNNTELTEESFNLLGQIVLKLMCFCFSKINSKEDKPVLLMWRIILKENDFLNSIQY